MSIVVAVLGLLAKAANDWLQANITPTKLAHVSDLARVAVLGAEKLGNEVLSGPNKYIAAEMALKAGAKRFGIKLTDAEASAYIHSALAELTGLPSDQPAEAAA